ncbi:MAG: hypothetical protein RIT43_1059 [Bacteroidota bacterium]|jgi:hypothetical protein
MFFIVLDMPKTNVLMKTEKLLLMDLPFQKNNKFSKLVTCKMIFSIETRVLFYLLTPKKNALSCQSELLSDSTTAVLFFLIL